MDFKDVKVCGKMISGIDGIIQGDMVTMSLTDNELVITNGIITRCIKHEDVLGVKTVDDVNVQQQYVSSIGGAIVGGALFGVAGAAVGDRAKKKEIRSVDTWLVITYKEDEQPKNIAVMTVDFKYNYIINKYTKPVQTTKTNSETQPKKKKRGCLIAFLIFAFMCFAIMTGITNENKAKQNDTEQRIETNADEPEV